VKSVKEVEFEVGKKLDSALASILQDLGYTIPESLEAKASLLDSNGRKKRSNASAENWSPVSGRIEVRFEPASQDEMQVSAVGPIDFRGGGEKFPNARASVHPAEAALIMALDRAEARPGWNFVPLKKFRDEILLQEHHPTMPTDVERRNVLNSVIEKKFVLLGKVVNPKSPQFPVTTIRLNRLMSEVMAVLGRTDGRDLDFHPVQISGEPLSTTILRERR
jgi:hypothetical protein